MGEAGHVGGAFVDAPAEESPSRRTTGPPRPRHKSRGKRPPPRKKGPAARHGRPGRADRGNGAAPPAGCHLPELTNLPDEAARIEDYFVAHKAQEVRDADAFGTMLRCSGLDNVFFYPHQVETTVQVVEQMQGRALLADEVGLGKTVEAGLILREYIHRGLASRVLILTPASLVLQWREELATKFGFKFRTLLDGGQAVDEPFVIASIDSAKTRRYRKSFQDNTYDMVIVDEAHKLKNHRSLNWRFVSSLRTKFLLLLSATPIQNSLEELYNLVFILKPGYFKTRKGFRRRFTVRSNARMPKNPEELRRLLSDVMIRHRRGDTEIPFTQRSVHLIPVDFTPEEKEAYTYLQQFITGSYGALSHFEKGLNRLTLILMERMVTSSPHALDRTVSRVLDNPAVDTGFADQLKVLRQKLSRIGAISKTDKLIELIDRLQGKVIIFTQFRETQEHLMSVLRKKGVDCVRFFGGLSPRAKDKTIREFAERARVLVSTDSGAEGRNLQFCRYVVNFDLPWNPMKVEQRIGRVHRLGQRRDVEIFNIYYRGSIEEYVVELLMHKIRLFKLVVGELDIILGLSKQSLDLEQKIMDIYCRSRNRTDMRTGFDRLGRVFSSAVREYEKIKKAQDSLF